MKLDLSVEIKQKHAEYNVVTQIKVKVPLYRPEQVHTGPNLPHIDTIVTVCLHYVALCTFCRAFSYNCVKSVEISAIRYFIFTQ